jgi:N-acetylglucosaminyldiphosphoundecaprenol N-acetyl-beta-D-mannosaminyltransferase
MRLDIAGLEVDNITIQETLDRIAGFVRSGQPHYIVTAYSEFVVEASRNARYREVLNRAHLCVPDGIGIVWAAKFLSLPKKDPIVTFMNWIGTLASVVLAPQSLRSVIREQVTGSRLIYDIAEQAQKNGFSLALVGGWNGVAEKSAEVLKQKYPGLKISLAYCPAAFEESAVEKIAQSNSDILLIAYQPPKQEMWLADNIGRLNVKVAIGLGGTFDYLSGERSPAPDWVHYLGLEWFWRLVTQPWRWKRMWNAIPVFSWLVLRHKLNHK